MIRSIVRKELTEVARDGRLRLLAVLLVVLALGLAATGYQQVQSHARAQATAQQHERERWLDQGEKTPHSAAHYGVYAFRAPGALAYFDPGLNPYVGVTVWMEAHWQNEPRFRTVEDAGPLSRFGQLTPAAVLGALLPLLVFGVMAPSVSGERERGTWRQLLAQGVPVRRLLWGKVLAGAVLVLLVSLPLLLVFAAMAWFLDPGTDTLVRFAVLGLVLLAYLAALLLLSVTVSAAARTERAALGVLLVFWIVTTLVAPRLVMEWAEYRAPTPSGVEFRQALQADLGDKEALEQRIAERRQALLAEHGVDDVHALPMDFDGVRLRMDDEHGYQVFDRHFGALYDGYRAQDRFRQTVGLLVPYVSWSALSSGMAGTDLPHFRHFIDAAEQHRRVIQDLMSEAMIENPAPDGERYLADGDLWDRVPEFRYSHPALGEVLPEYARLLAAPLLWLLLGVIALEWAGRRARAD